MSVRRKLFRESPAIPASNTDGGGTGFESHLRDADGKNDKSSKNVPRGTWLGRIRARARWLGFTVLWFIRWLFVFNVLVRGMTYVIPHCPYGIGLGRIVLTANDKVLDACMTSATLYGAGAGIVLWLARIWFEYRLNRLTRGWWPPYLYPDGYVYCPDTGRYLRTLNATTSAENSSMSTIPASERIMTRLSSVRIGAIPLLGLLYFDTVGANANAGASASVKSSDNNHKTDDDTNTETLELALKHQCTAFLETIHNVAAARRFKIAEQILTAIKDEVVDRSLDRTLFSNPGNNSDTPNAVVFTVSIDISVSIRDTESLQTYLNSVFGDTIRIGMITIVKPDDSLVCHRDQTHLTISGMYHLGGDNDEK